MSKYYAFLAILAVALLMGCTQSLNTNSATGLETNNSQSTVEVTTHQCADGSVVDDLSNCPPIKSTEPNILDDLLNTKITCSDKSCFTNALEDCSPATWGYCVLGTCGRGEILGSSGDYCLVRSYVESEASKTINRDETCNVPKGYVVGTNRESSPDNICSSLGRVAFGLEGKLIQNKSFTATFSHSLYTCSDKHFIVFGVGLTNSSDEEAYYTFGDSLSGGDTKLRLSNAIESLSPEKYWNYTAYFNEDILTCLAWNESGDIGKILPSKSKIVKIVFDITGINPTGPYSLTTDNFEVTGTI